MKKLFVVFIGLLLVTCGEDEITPRSYPRVRTHAVDNITSSGAVLHAEITFSTTEIIDHGFVWSNYNVPTISLSEIISLGSKSGVGPFEISVQRSLSEGVKYYVRAYARSIDHTVYGDQVEFVSLGSGAPSLTDVLPAQGMWGDTLTIKGKNFSKINPNFKIRFNAADADIIAASDTSASVIVPDELLEEKSSVSVSLQGNGSTLTDAFELSPPVILSVSPNTGSYGEWVTITGSGFNTISSKVYFSSKQAPVSILSRKMIMCTVPRGLPSGSIKLFINPGVESQIVEAPFFSEAPHITSITPAEATFNDEVIISGEFFGSTISSNSVKFGNIPAEVTSATTEEIRVKVPYNLTTPEHEVTVITDQDETTFENKFKLLAPVITDISPTQISSNVLVTITGSNFNPMGGNTIRFGSVQADWIESLSASEIKVRVPVNIHAHTLNASVTTAEQTGVSTNLTSAWVKMAATFSEGSANGISFVHNGYAYFGLGQIVGPYSQPPSSKMWKFDPVTENYTQLSDFQSGGRSRSVFFKLGNKGYMGGGTYDIYWYNDFYEYDFTTDQWEQKNNLPFPPEAAYGAVGFTVDNRAFVIAGSDLWEYIPTTDEWIPKSYFPADSRVSQNGFSYNGNLYVFGGNSGSFPYYPTDIWKYSLSSDQWTYLGEVPPEVSLYPFVFNINNEIYVGDSGSYSEENSFWKYDPQSNEFIRLQAYGGNGQEGSFNFVISGKGYMISGFEIINATMAPGGNCWKFDPDFL